MPFINVKMAQGRNREKKQELVEALTGAVVRILDVEAEHVTVVIDEYSREDWATAGQLHAIKYGHGFGKQGAEK